MLAYKKIYETEIGSKIDGRIFDIHHLDENRENNDFSNLLMLPKTLHHKYHFYKNRLVSVNDFVTDILTVFDGGYMCNDYAIEQYNEFLAVWKECNKWADYKLYKTGKLDNIHNIKEEEYK